ncbi:msl3283 [Mesorhizobium japonicum MAFF 303099]|uniref:Msl3283 protein n=1 Tax=Mesorhizobium japonicum (strain LMG 29417 / CECT 9101 / MAFF 303099) TaxID=266835 RepID=Q98GK6_RHILO|nr:msl3283 [Mesorhizobium japonicum MAFF 303099]
MPPTRRRGQASRLIDGGVRLRRDAIAHSLGCPFASSLAGPGGRLIRFYAQAFSSRSEHCSVVHGNMIIFHMG